MIVAASVCAPAGAAAPEPSGDAPVDGLAEIVVTAHKAVAPTPRDLRNFNAAADLQSVNGTAADILNEIPSVEVDASGAVSLRGASNVTILVDGKPTALLSGANAGDGLLQLPATEIARVEVITNPSAEYKADGSAGIINIIMKRSRKPGSSGKAQASLGNDGRHIVATNGSYNDGPLNLSAGIGLREDERQRIVGDNRAATDPISHQVVLSQEQINEHLRRMVPSIKGEVGYRFTDRESLDFSFSVRERRGNRNFYQADQSESSAGTPIGISNRLGLGQERRLDSEQKLQFVQELARPDETLTIAVRHSVQRKRENYDYSNTFALPAAAPNYDTLNLNHDLATTEVSADYVLPFDKVGGLKFGYDFEQDTSGIADSGGALDPATGQVTPNPLINNQFNFVQSVHALYGSYEVVQGLWDYLGGLRWEQTSTTLSKNYGGAYPSLHIERRLTEASTLSVSANRRVTRPNAELLNPFIDYKDTQNLRAGNPNLLPEDSRSFEIEYDQDWKHLHYGVTGYFRRNRNSFTDLAQPVSNTVVLITKANLPSDRSEGLEFIASGRSGRHWSYGLSANLFDRQIDVAALGIPGMKSTVGLNLKANLEFRPTIADTAQISFSRSDKRLTPQGYIDPINVVNLGYRRTLGGDWSAVLTVSDLFNGQVLRRFVATPTLTDIYRREQVGRIAYIGVVYAFGSRKKHDAAPAVADDDDEPQ